MEYKHTQSGYLAVVVLLWLVVVGAFVVAAAGGEEDAALSLALTGGALVVIEAVVIWFSRLTVTVRAGQVRVHFGMGKPKRVFEVHNIVGIKQVRNKWHYGWGMRKVPQGWMFNVWGLDAVELDLANGRRFRIGTDEPADLLAALSAHTALRPG